ncbi:uracil-DNA glycosylase [Helicovermis profundi]|uniref:Uracil-DNA glycosylase n=2 Tax=Helicovermis profundi TaxID=3065157 RepID=A0AAU9E0W1_9FIRM|nr:uracil-DNA glycosylase [Clostridia bacterium S502]
MNTITNDWKDLLKEEFSKDYFTKLMKFLDDEYRTNTIYPPRDMLFSALDLCPFKDTKVVILGQDPYHEPNQAHGLSFSVAKGVKIPPSLRNIFKELNDDLNIEIPRDGFLENWAKQGVLMINNVFSVRKGQAHSHKNKGWEIFTDKIISLLNEKESPIVFILWGKPSQKKEKLITSNMHLVLKAPHPSPLSSYRGFFKSKPFSKTNEFLKLNSLKEIDWKL